LLSQYLKKIYLGNSQGSTVKHPLIVSTVWPTWA